MRGAGKYDEACTLARLFAGARAAVLIVFDGDKGSGFEVQADAITLHLLPETLERLARDIRADLERSET